MKKSIFTILTGILFAFTFYSCSEKEQEQAEKFKYEYQTFENDPLDVKVYTLDNGLKIYMSVNKDEPRIQTNIAVNTGSKQDPADATGLAHYLEHMLFKGTSELGTINWEKEKELLEMISGLYEEHRETDNPEERKNIYKKIDSVSNIAAKYAVANEYDKMIGSIGARGTNAYTSFERTVYINDIPSNELEKWLMVESERFSKLVLRLFHTELETVYEEFNRGQDSDYRQAFQALMKNIFKTHPYGTQTTIGTGEHLKTPSMEKIHQYFDKHYAPNNMAIVLSGDLDPDETVDMVKKYFGDYKKKEVPEFTFQPEEPIKSPRKAEVKGRDRAFVQLGFRFDGAKSENTLYLKLMDQLLSNGQAGLIDINLEQKQKVLSAYSGTLVNKDYSVMLFNGVPREGQTLDEVKELLLNQIEIIKKGEFEDWMLEAIINDLKVRRMKRFENNGSRAYLMSDAFIKKINWEEYVNEIDRMDKITKKDLVDWVNKNFNDNYAIVYKREGKPEIHKVEKPLITPIEIDRDTQSVFYTRFDSIKSGRIKPVFVDYKKEIDQRSLESGIELNYIENKTNELFDLYYILDMGRDNDRELALAVKYLPYLGTEKYSPEELQKEFFKLGLDYNVYSSRDRVYVSLNGLEENFEEGLRLFEEIINEVKEAPEAYKELVKGILKERKDDKLSKRNILYGGLFNYSKYGTESPFRNILSEEELNNIEPASLTEKIKALPTYKHRVFFYGTMKPEDVSKKLNKFHKIPAELKDYPPAKEYKELEMEEDKVYFAHYDMVQTEMMFVSKGPRFNKQLLGPSNLFNQYFGSGLSSIVFQEIRESKALAYSAYCVFITPDEKDNSHYIRAYVGTQTDKLADAKKAMLEIMNEMPESSKQFNASKLSALKQIETNRITKKSIFWNYLRAQKKGLDYDVRKDVYKDIKKMEMKELREFFNKYIKGKKFTYLVIGHNDKVNKEELKEMGKYRELSLEELFGY